MANSRKRPRASLAEHLATFLQSRLAPGQRLLLGLSGGLDSRVLLDLLAKIQPALDFRLSAIHVNHQISPHADAWADFCGGLCAGDNIPFQAVTVDVPRDSGLGLEAAAREERYRVLLAQEADAIVLAHHQDDQAETLLLQLLRGAGVKGLAAMPAAVERQGRLILRPLLEVSRAQLRDYAREQHLQWIEDESNLDLAYDRNYLRRQILPALEQRFTAARRTLARSAAHLAEAATLLEEVAQEDARSAVSAGRLNLAEVKSMSEARAANLLRWWLADQGGVQLSAARLDDIRKQLLHAKPDARIHIKLGASVLRRRRGLAFIEPATVAAPARHSPAEAPAPQLSDAGRPPE